MSGTDVSQPGWERRVVTLLFADVTGSTALGERLDPERMHDVLETYFAAMKEEIEAEGGTIEKYIGDAIVAAFGVPAAHEDDPARALRAALRMRRRLPAVNRELQSDHGVVLEVRIGVNTGEVLAAVDPAPGEAMFTGDAVNVAARFEQEAPPGQIVTSERTMRAARGFRFRALAPLDLKGKSAPVRAFAVEDEIAHPERGVPGLSAPLVGRDTEIGVLRSVYERAAREGRPHLVTLYGDAGVGKSRLAREFVAWTERNELAPLVLRGRCLPYGDGVTYWPLAEILKGHAGILDSDAPEVAVEKVRKVGRDLLKPDVATDPVRAGAALAYTVGLEDPDVSLGDADPREVRDEVHAAWRSFFTALGRERPVVVLVEDIHWANPVMLDLLEELAERVEGPVVFLCPSRPDLTAIRPGWGGGRRNISSLALDPLSAGDAERLVHLLLTVDDLPPSVHERILERAEGNPFYLEEIVRRLIDGGLLVHDEGRWLAAAGIEEVDIPDTVQAVLASRIDLLERSDKSLLQAASVVGRVFWPGPVSELSGVVGPDLTDALRRMEERELVLSRPGSSLAGQPEYIFKHVLTRDVAYESIPRRDRAAAHTAVARWVERTAGERAGEFAEVLAYHLATAVTLAQESGGPVDDDLRTAALRWLLRASTDARRRLVLRKAQRLAEEALAFATDELQRCDALDMLAEAFNAAYTGDLAWRYFREAAVLRARTEPPDDARVAYLAARACEVCIRWPGSIRGIPPGEADVRNILNLGLEHLPPGDSEERIRLLALQAGWSFAFPDATYTDEQIEGFERAGVEAAEIAMRKGLPNLASAALDNAQGAWVSQGNYRRAIPLWSARARVMTHVTDVLEIGDFYAMGAWAHYQIGAYRRALEIADEGVTAIGGRAANVEIHLRAWRCALQYRLGSWDEAMREFQFVRDLLDERRDEPPYFAGHAFAIAGTIEDARGNRVEADRLADLFAGLGRLYSGRLYPFLLRFLVRRGDLERASSMERPSNWSIHAGDAYEAESELLAASGTWDAAPDLASMMRAYSASAGTEIVPAFADRLEGRAGLAAGDPERAVELFTRAISLFDRLVAVWERALTEADLARALDGCGRRDDAEDARARAITTFEELKAVNDVAAARRR